MVLVQKQTHRSMGQTGELRKKSLQIWSINLWQTKHIQWGKDSDFNTWRWENQTATCKRMKLDHCLTPLTKINSKWNKNSNVRPKAIKLLEENIGGKPLDIRLGIDFFGFDTKPKATKAINKQDYICTAKETINKMKGKPEWEKIFANHLVRD